MPRNATAPPAQETVLLVYGDGALYGASTDRAALSRRYWPGFFLSSEQDGEPFALVVASVPGPLSLRLCDVGMNLNGGFRDGYQALRAAMEADPTLAARLPRQLGGSDRRAREARMKRLAAPSGPRMPAPARCAHPARHESALRLGAPRPGCGELRAALGARPPEV